MNAAIIYKANVKGIVLDNLSRELPVNQAGVVLAMLESRALT